MTNVSIAFQGERGAFSEAAAVEHLGLEVRLLPCRTLDRVFEAVSSGEAERGVVPIENTLGGSVHRVYDLLLQHPLTIVGERTLRIVHCLVALPGTALEEVQRVHSHPQALAQCEETLRRLGDVELVSTYDTAGAVAAVREEGVGREAAIAGRRAAEVYDMEVIESGIEDFEQNYTRFLILASEEDAAAAAPASAERRGDRDEPGGRVDGESVAVEAIKTSIVFAFENVPGALFKALSAFALREIDLTKIESRPLKGRPFEYLFYLDFLGHVDEERCQNALSHLREICHLLRILGSYPRGDADAGG